MADDPTRADDLTDPSELPEESAAPVEETAAPETPSEPDPARFVPIDRFNQVSQEAEGLRQTLLMAQQEMLRRSGQPEQQRDPFDDPSLTPEWKESLRVTERFIAPAIERRLAPHLATLAQRQAQFETQSESLMLHQRAAVDPRYAEFPQFEQQAAQAQQMLRQQGVNLPLEAVYFYLRGQSGAPAAVVQQAEQRGAARARAAGNARVETAAPATGGRSISRTLTPEQIATMSTTELERRREDVLAALGDIPF